MDRIVEGPEIEVGAPIDIRLCETGMRAGPVQVEARVSTGLPAFKARGKPAVRAITQHVLDVRGQDDRVRLEVFLGMLDT
jgi:hypothetical protein